MTDMKGVLRAISQRDHGRKTSDKQAECPCEDPEAERSAPLREAAEIRRALEAESRHRLILQEQLEADMRLVSSSVTQKEIHHHELAKQVQDVRETLEAERWARRSEVGEVRQEMQRAFDEMHNA